MNCSFTEKKMHHLTRKCSRLVDTYTDLGDF